MEKNIDIARSLYKQSILAMPIQMPTKSPPKGWSQMGWYDAFPSEEDFESVWSRHGNAGGIAIICGRGIEVVDVDTKNDPSLDIHERFSDLLAEIAPDIHAKLLIETTVSGGMHFWYKTQGDYPGTALAKIVYDDASRFALGKEPAETTGVVIETRGRRQYCAIAGTPGYEIVNGASFLDLPVLTETERDIVLGVARSFNEYFRTIDPPVSKSQTTAGRPGDAYNASVSDEEIISLLMKWGWRMVKQIGHNIYFTRPGKTSGISGSWSTKHRAFACYSTSTGMKTISDGAYSAFSLYTHLEHNNNFQASASALKAQGYSISDSPLDVPPAKIDGSDERLFVFDVNNLPKGKAAALMVYGDRPKLPGGQRPEFFIAAPGQLVAILGREKSRKTTVLSSIIASMFTDTATCRFFWPQKMPKILWVDTEQDHLRFWMTIAKLQTQAGFVSQTVPGLRALSLRYFTKKERQDIIKAEIAAHDPDVIIIDGLVDIAPDFNDAKLSYEFLDQFLMRLSPKAITFGVLHVNKTDKNARGHLGTMLTQKADCCISIEPEDDYTVLVTNTANRDEKFPAFTLQTKRGMFNLLYADVEPTYDYSLLKRGMEMIDKRSIEKDQIPAPAAMPRNVDEDLPF